MKKFVPFDQFERECLPDSKPLAETMQENCNDRLKPSEEPCGSPCVPYWQATGEKRCSSNMGVMEIEEADGCCNTRWVRIAEDIAWVDTGNTECDDAKNRIKVEQQNQCGELRWITSQELCCTPVWVPSEEEVTKNCEQSVVRDLEEDGCGHTRWVSTAVAVNWESTGEDRCQPGNVHEIEQINQCGDLRWISIGACSDESVDISPNIRDGLCLNETVVDAGYWVGIGIRFRPNGIVEYRTAVNTLLGGTWYVGLDVNPNDYEVHFNGVATGPGTTAPNIWWSMNLDRFFYNEQTLVTPTGATWISGIVQIRNRETGVVVFNQELKAVNSRSDTGGYCDTWPDVPPVPPE